MNKTKLSITANLTVPDEKFPDLFGGSKPKDQFYSGTTINTKLNVPRINELLNALNLDLNKILFAPASFASDQDDLEADSSESMKCQIDITIKA